VTTQMIPAIFLSMIALQLTASQGLPRGAPFSRLDKLFFVSYVTTIIVLLLALFRDVCGGWWDWLRAFNQLSFIPSADSLSTVVPWPWVVGVAAVYLAFCLLLMRRRKLAR
jgi:hypothetical protein